MMKHQKGFSLIELAIGLVIIGLIFGGAIVSLSTQKENEGRRETEDLMRTVKEAITGFAMVRGYIPCPATAGSNGQENRGGGGTCNNQHGFVPYAALGLSASLDSNRRLVDSWGHPMLYSVTTADNNGNGSPDFTTPGEMRSVTMQVLSPDLRVCQAANCPGGTEITDSAPVVIISTGKNGAVGQGTGEQENTDNADNQFVSSAYSHQDGNGHFDDLVEWISPQLLYNRMVNAGQLP